jgi:Mpv17 / PMP22 family
MDSYPYQDPQTNIEQTKHALWWLQSGYPEICADKGETVFGMQAVLTGEQPSGVIDRIQKAVPVSIKNSLKLWPAVTAFSFAFILPQYRFMFSGIFAVIWQGYLSFLNRKEEKSVRKVGMRWALKSTAQLA